MHMSPVITFAAFVAINISSGIALDAATIFTALSLLSLLTQPLSQTFQSIPNFLAALGCFQRIQDFLDAETKSDHRLLLPGVSRSESSSSPPREDHEGIELQSVRPLREDLDDFSKANEDVIVVRNGTFGWNSSDLPVIQDVSFSIKGCQLTVIIGPVACGKSTLLKALLGETPSFQGFVHVASTDIAFCDQTPWLINGTLQHNILGFSTFDGPWYNSVIHACNLEEDLAMFPKGDQTLIGSKGITLSGGQKHRVV